MRSENAEQSPPGRTVPRVLWRGLSFWNFYFFSKLLLYWGGYINLHVFYNLLFAAALLIPLPPVWLHRLRHLIAVPCSQSTAVIAASIRCLSAGCRGDRFYWLGLFATR